LAAIVPPSRYRADDAQFQAASHPEYGTGQKQIAHQPIGCKIFLAGAAVKEYSNEHVKRIFTKELPSIQCIEKNDKESIVIATPMHIKVAMIEGADKIGRAALVAPIRRRPSV
jgi:hypothetical protein